MFQNHFYAYYYHYSSKQAGSNSEKISDIKEAISRYIRDNCDTCVFSPQYIVDAKLACGNEKDNEFVFVGSFLSTAELNSTAIRDTVLQEYIRREMEVNVAGEMLQINRYCSAQVLDEVNYGCYADGKPTLAAVSGKSPVNLAIEIAIGAGAGLVFFLLVFVGCLVLCICCLRRDVRTKYKEPRTEDLSIQ